MTTKNKLMDWYDPSVSQEFTELFDDDDEGSECDFEGLDSLDVSKLIL